VELGDAVEAALSAAGITQDRVRRWLGDCGCEDRKRRLNSLGRWAAGVLAGRVRDPQATADDLLRHGPAGK
jgi:hypothetical protein